MFELAFNEKELADRRKQVCMSTNLFHMSFFKKNEQSISQIALFWFNVQYHYDNRRREHF